MRTRTKLILPMIVLAVGVTYFALPKGGRFHYDPKLLDAFTRIGAINKIYSDYPDSARLLKKLILDEEAITEEELLHYQNFLKSRPECFSEFLDSVDARIELLMTRPYPEIKKEIYPRIFIIK